MKMKTEHNCDTTHLVKCLSHFIFLLSLSFLLYQHTVTLTLMHAIIKSETLPLKFDCKLLPGVNGDVSHHLTICV